VKYRNGIIEPQVSVDRISLSAAVFEDLLKRKLDADNHFQLYGQALDSSLAHSGDDYGPSGDGGLTISAAAGNSTADNVSPRNRSNSGNIASHFQMSEEEQQRLIEAASAAIFNVNIQSNYAQSILQVVGGDADEQAGSSSSKDSNSSGTGGGTGSGRLNIAIEDSNFADSTIKPPTSASSVRSNGSSHSQNTSINKQSLYNRVAAALDTGDDMNADAPINHSDHHTMMMDEDDDDEDEDFTIVEEIIPGRDFRVTFTKTPLGLTLTKSISGTAEVTKVIENGQAFGLDVQVGDILVGVEFSWVRGYDEAMGLLTKAKYPLALVFRRATRKIESRSPAPSSATASSSSSGRPGSVPVS
jgi:hypothetical protein